MTESEIGCPDCRAPLTGGRSTCPGCGRDVASLLPTEAPTPPAPVPGIELLRIGDFRILSTIGRGGMGTVYEAYQESMRRKVALKVLDAGFLPSTDQVARFEREAWIGGRLSHPNIVKVHAQGTDGTHHYIAMELVEGPSLATEIAEARKQREATQPSDSAWRAQHVRRMVQLFVCVADALEHVHQQGIVHRDIKPGNLLLTADGTRLLVSDFGLARDAEASQLTRRGDFFGTVRYMSPEQLLAHRVKVDHRSDIWSLGVSLYEVLTLALPHVADSEEAYISAVSTKEPVPARRRNRAVPRDLETILMKCLERDPARRYQSASDLKDDLLRYLEGMPPRARRAGLLSVTWRVARRHRSALSMLLVGGALGLISLALWSNSGRRGDDLRRLTWTLQQVIDRRGRPERMQPDWKRLAVTLGEQIRRDPQGEIARLALRATYRIDASVDRFGSLAKMPYILVAWYRILDPGFQTIQEHSHRVELQSQWDGAEWSTFSHLSIYRIRNGIRDVVQEVDSINILEVGEVIAPQWGRLELEASARRRLTSAMKEIERVGVVDEVGLFPLSEVLPRKCLTPGPHQLRLRASITVLDVDPMSVMQDYAYPTRIAANVQTYRQGDPGDLALLTEVVEIGSFPISLFEQVPELKPSM